MPTAKKLPSGSWRCQVFSHYEEVRQPDGSTKKKRIYESFTSTDPSKKGKREAELAAIQFAAKRKERLRPSNLTLREAIDKYISASDAVLSPTTINGYKIIREHAFSCIMDIPLSKLNRSILQEAVNEEAKRKRARTDPPVPISAKTVKNEYGLITAVLKMYAPDLDCSVRLPQRPEIVKELLTPDQIFEAVRGDWVELPVLLAMWLSFTSSEIRGIRKSTAIRDGYITIQQVKVTVNGKSIVKKQAKTQTRIRKLRIPPYIQALIDRTSPEEDFLVPYTHAQIYSRFSRLLQQAGLPHMSFHDLRHVNASVMALLRIPDKYAQERGGWKTDAVMKRVYVQTFSENRTSVDDLIDTYFENMQHKTQHKN